MTLKTYDLNQFELEEKVKQIANLLEEKIILPIFDKECSDERYCILVKKNGYYYYFCNRGKKDGLRITIDVNELIFWIFKDATHNIAVNYEYQNRKIGQDFRIIIFRKHVEILQRIGIEKLFIDKLKNRYNGLLGQNLW